jgi:hypothetical protein
MCRYLLACALLFSLLGCSSEPPKPVAVHSDAPVAMPARSTAPEKPGPAEKELASIIDLPLYPGSKLVKNTVADTDAGKRYHVTLESRDTAKEIADFYKSKGVPGEQSGDRAKAMGETKKGNLVIIQVTKKGNASEITIAVSRGMGHG